VAPAKSARMNAGIAAGLPLPPCNWAIFAASAAAAGPGTPRAVSEAVEWVVVALAYFIAGILALDKWTCNTNGRQAVFFRAAGESRYRAWMIDQGFCFNAGEWNFPDAPLRGLYARHRVYESARGMEAFEPWIARIEGKMTEAVFDEVYKEIPGEWYGFDTDALERMLEQLLRRRKRVRELVISAWKSSAQPFPNWK